MIIQNKFSNFIIPRRYNGITIFPFIFLRTGTDANESLIRHEKIHIQQQLECLLLGFVILYYYYYIKLRLQGYKHDTAYRLIPFEREAYWCQNYTEYLKNRKRFAWSEWI